MGSKGLPSANKPITISEIWSYNEETGVYSKKDAKNTALLKSAPSGSGNACSCSNTLKEVEY